MAGLHSVAHLIPVSSGRCGVYVLHFADGTAYVGQAVDVVRRFADHRRHLPPICSFDFRRVPTAHLDDAERELIRTLEASGMHLHNKIHSTHVLGDSDLDLHVTRDEQLAWLTDDVDLDDVSTDRADDTTQRLLRRPGFETLIAHPRWEQVQFALAAYVQGALPRPRETERTFWAVSAMPATARSRYSQRLFTVSVNLMETFVVGELTDPDGGDTFLTGFVNLDGPALLAGRTQRAFERTYRELINLQPAPYRSAGPNAVAASFFGLEGLFALILDEHFWPAARTLALQLMRKGPTLQWRWHCYDLADHAFTPLPDPGEDLGEHAQEPAAPGDEGAPFGWISCYEGRIGAQSKLHATADCARHGHNPRTGRPIDAVPADARHARRHRCKRCW